MTTHKSPISHTDSPIEKYRILAGTGLKNCNDSIYRVVTTFI